MKLTKAPGKKGQKDLLLQRIVTYLKICKKENEN
jgi:hypothetical protein